jgi:hypothetical protein
MTNRIIYYYQTFTDLNSILVPGCPVTHIHLSAVHFGVNTDGTPYIHLNNNDPDDHMFDKVWSDLKKANDMGIKIILMVGGAGGAFNTLFNNYSTYFPLLINTIKKHNMISGIDLDVEESVKLDDIKKLINDVVKTFDNKFIITMAPIAESLESDSPGMGGFIYKDLFKSDEGKYINYFNGQFYGSYQFSDFDNVVKNGYPANKVVMGMISGQDFNMVLNTLKQIKIKYPDMGGVFIWEYFNAPNNWDNRVSTILNSNLQNMLKWINKKCNFMKTYIQVFLNPQTNVNEPIQMSNINELD